MKPRRGSPTGNSIANYVIIGRQELKGGKSYQKKVCKKLALFDLVVSATVKQAHVAAKRSVESQWRWRYHKTL